MSLDWPVLEINTLMRSISLSFFFGAERDTNMLGGVWRFDENTPSGSDNKDSKTDMGKVAFVLQPSQSRKQY